MAASRGKPFTKGDPRINRKGRPKRGKSLADRIADALNEVLDPETGYTRMDSIIDAFVTKAMKGNQDAFEYLTNRAFGKVVERIETTNVNKNFNLSKLTDEDLKILEEMQKKMDETDDL